VALPTPIAGGLAARSAIGATLENRLHLINPVLRGWSNFYRHANWSKHIF
jgi:hypothetical protein